MPGFLYLRPSERLHDAPAEPRCQDRQVLGAGELDAQYTADQVLQGLGRVGDSHLADRNGRDVRSELPHAHAVPAAVPPHEVVAQHRAARGHTQVGEQRGDPAADERALGLVLPLVELLPEVAQVDLQSCDVAVDRVQQVVDGLQIVPQRREELHELVGVLPEQQPVLGRALDLDVRDPAVGGQLVVVVRTGCVHEGADQGHALLGVHGGQLGDEQLTERPTDGLLELHVEALVGVGPVPQVRVEDAWTVQPVGAQQFAVAVGELADVLADLADHGVPEHLGSQAQPQMGGVGLVGALDQQARGGDGLGAEGGRGQTTEVMRADVRDAGEFAAADPVNGVPSQHAGQEAGRCLFGDLSGPSPVVRDVDVVHEVLLRVKVHCGVATAVDPGGMTCRL